MRNTAIMVPKGAAGLGRGSTRLDTPGKIDQFPILARICRARITGKCRRLKRLPCSRRVEAVGKNLYPAAIL